MADMLSQDEIDALLSGASEPAPKASPSPSAVKNGLLTADERDALGEVGNISMGTAATTLSTLLGQKVSITTPTVTETTIAQLADEIIEPCVTINIRYKVGIDGLNMLVLHEKDVKIITDLMMGGDGTNTDQDLTDLHLSAIGEAMNQMIGSSSTSMSEMLKRKVDISPPEAHYNRIDSLEDNNVDLNKDDDIVKVAFNMKIGDLIDSQIMQLMPIDVAKQLVSILIGSQEESKPVAQNAQPAPKQTQTSTQTKQNQPIEQPMQNNSPPPQRQVQQPVNTQPLQFDNFDSQPVYYGYNSDINLIRDVPLEISVELGKTSKRISEILDFGPGSVIELDKLVGEPLDILANGKLIAKGEVVVVDENYGVRITDIIMPDERIKKL